MIYTTFARAKRASACIKSYEKFAKFKGGIAKWGIDTPFPLSEVLEICGLGDTIWCFRCTVEPSNNILIEFACRCAEHVLHFYEDRFPNDKRPRQAIEVARVYSSDKTGAARAAVWAAAWAAGAAAWAARAAVWAAAWAAEAAAEAAWAAEAAAEAAAWAADGAAGAARAAAEAAAWAADGAADGAAVWAARTTETEWQTKMLLELLK